MGLNLIFFITYTRENLFDFIIAILNLLLKKQIYYSDKCVDCFFGLHEFTFQWYISKKSIELFVKNLSINQVSLVDSPKLAISLFIFTQFILIQLYSSLSFHLSNTALNFSPVLAVYYVR